MACTCAAGNARAPGRHRRSIPSSCATASRIPPQFTAASPVVTIAEQVGPAVVGVAALTGRSFTGEGGMQQGSGVIFDYTNGYM